MLLVIVGITIAQSALIGLLLLERQRRIRAQRWVESQAAFEQMLAAVKVEVAGQALDEAPHALEHAIAHLGRYAGAASAELSIDAPMPERSSGIVRWTSQGAQPSLHDSDVGASVSVALPLMSEGTLLGTMTLHGVPIDGSHAMTRERLQLAADVITEALARTQSSQALAEARGHVAYLGRMATMGQLSAVVSHELRQPLTAIRFNADAGSLLLRKEPIDLRELSLVLRDIGNDAVLASDLIDQVRTLFRKQRGARVPVSINNVCRHAMRLLQRVAEERGVRVEVELAEELPEVPGDAVQLQQVVLNLELNAIESAAASEHERRVLIRTTQRANAIRLEVGDSGSGLPPVVREHLFQSGFSTKTSGFGMGLVIVHQIVLAHNGQVSADNRPGGGALFRVTLPIDAMVGMPPVTERSEVRLAGSAVFGS
jgi:signal transduction histidine kinase